MSGLQRMRFRLVGVAAIVAVAGVALEGSSAEGTAVAAKPAPKYGPGVARLSASNEFLRAGAAPDFWALIPYYVPQQDARSCSVASVAMVVNGARTAGELTASDELALQPAVLKKVNDKVWNRFIRFGARSIVLDELGEISRKALAAYGLTAVSVEVVHVSDTVEATKARVRKDLVENEKSADDFIILNFLQSSLTGDPEGAIGHIAPLAAFDAKTDRALILDPDRQYYEPYWVSLDALLAGMSTIDPGAGKARGYVRVRVRVR